MGGNVMQKDVKEVIEMRVDGEEEDWSKKGY